jgi:hypothetical protein
MIIPDIIELTEKQQDRLVDDCRVCHFCEELFKECDTLIPGVGVIVGETDVVKWKNNYWHYGCISDWLFTQDQDFWRNL